jgi:hypothetical protein
MIKPKPFKMRATKNQLLQIAVESVHRRNNLSMLYDYVQAGKQSGIITLDMRDIDRLIEENKDMLYGVGFKRQEEDNKLSDSVQFKDIIPNRSGMIEITGTAGTVEEALGTTAKNPEAEAKSLSLVNDVAKRYGWTTTGMNKSGNPTIFHHFELDLHVYAYSRPVLQVTGRDGIRRPCLQYESFMRDTPYKGDAIASLLITCIASPDMAQHIERFSPGYLEKWNTYQNELKTRIGDQIKDRSRKYTL